MISSLFCLFVLHWFHYLGFISGRYQCQINSCCFHCWKVTGDMENSESFKAVNNTQHKVLQINGLSKCIRLAVVMWFTSCQGSHTPTYLSYMPDCLRDCFVNLHHASMVVSPRHQHCSTTSVYSQSFLWSNQC